MAMETQDIIKRSATNPITPRRARGTIKRKSPSLSMSPPAWAVKPARWPVLSGMTSAMTWGTASGCTTTRRISAPNPRTVMRFSETEQNGKLEWLIRKDGCMHCAEPGCLKACPSAGAIIQYANGIVDFQQENCIGCGYCIAGCPFNVPRLNKEDNRVYKCTLCVDRVSVGRGAGLRENLSYRRDPLRYEERDAGGGRGAGG